MCIPSKTEVRFRQQTVIHDFVRESVRAALMKARPVPQFLTEIRAQPTASPGLTSPVIATSRPAGASCSDGLQRAPWRDLYEPAAAGGFALQAPAVPAATARLEFEGGIAVEANAAVSLARAPGGSAWLRQMSPISQFPITAARRRSRRSRKPRRLSSRCGRCVRWARFEIRSFSRSTKTASGSSINMWPTSACCSSESCANARRSRWRASVCSCPWSSN